MDKLFATEPIGDLTPRVLLLRVQGVQGVQDAGSRRWRSIAVAHRAGSVLKLKDWAALSPDQHESLAAFRVRLGEFQEHLDKTMRAVAIEVNCCLRANRSR